MSQLKTVVIGASGYSGAELARYVAGHPQMCLSALAVSDGSQDAGRKLSDLYPALRGVVELPLQPLGGVSPDGVDLVFLATAHEVSHDLAPRWLAAGAVVCDLSAAFRLNDVAFYPQFYGFSHQYPALLAKAAYGLAEWRAEEIRAARLIALPGCYPTAAQLALLPLLRGGVVDVSQWPVINATSGVSGAGRKATLGNSFCEVSLQPYGVFSHRHQPEIAHHLGTEVVFTPHLGNFVRGILATITCRLQGDVTAAQLRDLYCEAYDGEPLVRVYEQGLPAIKHVAGLPYCDLGFALSGRHVVVVSALDNLLKGAAAQAVQCANIHFGFAPQMGLL